MARPTAIRRLGLSRAGAPTAPSAATATRVRLCDRDGCQQPGDRPAPKAPNSPERWMFCEAHAAEYNKNWNYFAGLTPTKPPRARPSESAEASAFRQRPALAMGRPRRRQPQPRRDAGAGSARARQRCRLRSGQGRLPPAGQGTPSRPASPATKEAAKRFQQVQAAYRCAAPGRGTARSEAPLSASCLGRSSMNVPAPWAIGLLGIAAMGDAADEGDPAGSACSIRSARSTRLALEGRAADNRAAGRS